MCTTKFPIKISSLVVIVIAVLSLVACKGGNKTADADRLAADSLNKELLASDIKEVLYPLPTPFEMTKMLNDIGAKYTAKNLNSTANIEKYYTEQNKAVNLGIYGADLAY